MKKRITAVMLCLLLIFTFSGCAEDDGEGTYTITRAFINAEYLDTGSEENGIIVMLTTKLELDCAEEEKYEEAVEYLREEHMTAQIATLTLKTALSDKFRFNDIYFDNGTVNVDFKGDNLSGSSLEESLLITQIVETLTGSFSEVKNVQLLIDGKKAETLMGHVDISEPFVEGVVDSGAAEDTGNGTEAEI